MAHVEKYLKNQLGNMLAHYERSRNGKNEHINADSIYKNYNLAPDRGPLLDWVHQRLEGVKIQKRDDVKYMCDWIVTAPKDLPVEQHQAFFKGVYNFCCQKYGEENMISAYVHMDEATPHIHVAWVPVVRDVKKGGEKLSSKESLGGPKDLRQFHTDLQRELEQRLHCPVNVLNEATVNGNKSIGDLRRGEAQKRLEAASVASDVIKSHADRLLDSLQDAVAEAPANDFDEHWQSNFAAKWQYKQKIFGEDESKIEMATSDFEELFGDFERYYVLAKDLAAKNKELQEAIPQIKREANFLLHAGELQALVYSHNIRIQELGKQYNKAIKAERIQREEIEQLRNQAVKSKLELQQTVNLYTQLCANHKELRVEHEQLRKKFKTVDSIADDFFDMLKKYPGIMGKVLQAYANSTGRNLSYSEGGVCIGAAKCKVRELER